MNHGLRTPGEEIAFAERPKINFQFQIFRYGRNIFYRPHTEINTIPVISELCLEKFWEVFISLVKNLLPSNELILLDMKSGIISMHLYSFGRLFLRMAVVSKAILKGFMKRKSNCSVEVSVFNAKGTWCPILKRGLKWTQNIWQ